MRCDLLTDREHISLVSASHRLALYLFTKARVQISIIMKPRPLLDFTLLPRFRETPAYIIVGSYTHKGSLSFSVIRGLSEWAQSECPSYTVRLEISKLKKSSHRQRHALSCLGLWW
jgi:hypothetical protein